ncbi:hypothetical protein [Nostoc sp.]
MAYIYLFKEIPLTVDKEEEAVQVAKQQLKNLYSDLMQYFPLLEKEVTNLDPTWILEPWDFDPEMVSCDDWDEGSWNATYIFKISITSPDGNPDCDFEIDEWEEWHKLDEPMCEDVFEPLRKCNWQGFKRDNVSVEFSAIKAVDSYSGKGLHIYNNQGWL